MDDSRDETSSSSMESQFQQFEQWLVDNGAVFSQLELRKHPTNPPTASVDHNYPEEKKDTHPDSDDSEFRAVHASSPLRCQSTIVSIPLSLLITVEMGQATPIGRQVLLHQLELDAPKHIFLMIYLLWDKKLHGPQSFFAPYYNILPRHLANMPIFWTDHELRYLTGSPLLSQIEERAEAIQKDYRALCSLPLSPSFESICSLREFQWARMIVCSRNFGLVIHGHRTSALVPYADMLNHRRPRETKWTFCEDTQCFTVTTLREIGRGCQVFDSYGQKCNHRFLLNYGFCVEDNVEGDGFCPNEVLLELGGDTLDCDAVRNNVHNDEDGILANDCSFLEKKLAFWKAGEATSSSGIHGSDSVVDAVGALTGITECISSRQIANMISSHVTRAPPASFPQYVPQFVFPVKRIRVCVSNNENTRILFSMLRVLVCNSADWELITTQTITHHSTTTNASNNLILTPTPAQRLPGNRASLSSSLLPRTCRDIRYPLNLSNEYRAMNLLHTIVTRALSQYPTTLAQDNADLLDTVAYPKYSNRRHAKLQVRGEKEVLHHFALWAHTARQVLAVIWEELERERQRQGVTNRRRRGTLDGEEIESCSNPEGSFESITQTMEEDENCHLTILRYCTDVLGAVRQEELHAIATEASTTLEEDCSDPYCGLVC